MIRRLRVGPDPVRGVDGSGRAGAGPGRHAAARHARRTGSGAHAALVASLETPYYVEYSVHDSESVQVTASLGALSDVQRGHVRLPRIQVRVGDYKFDNGNYIYSDSNFGSGYDLGTLPIDDNYMALRQYFWLATDVRLQVGPGGHRPQASGAAERDRHRPDARFFQGRTGDAYRRLSPDEPWTRKRWKSRVRSLSALFAAYPRIIGSSVDVGIGQGAFYLVNSKGPTSGCRRTPCISRPGPRRWRRTG